MLYIALSLFVLAFLIWLFGDHGIDKIKNPEEWKDVGSSGEQITYINLRDKIHVPEKQILRNVYIPTADGKTSEIDLLVVSRKGLLVFECKKLRRQHLRRYETQKVGAILGQKEKLLL